jgi:PAS domain S-box-containing protein
MMRRGGRQGGARRFLTGTPLFAARLDEALARAPEGALAMGADGRVVGWNRAAEVITGYTAAQAIGRTCGDLFPRDARNGVCDPGCPLTALAADPLKTVDVPTRTRAGRPIWLNMIAVSVPVDGGRAVTVHLFRDVTATRELLALVQPALDRPDDTGAAAPARHVPLTRRELEVLRLVGQGLGTAAAAERLHISRMTIRNHVQNILRKLGVHSRLQAFAYAARHRLL